MIDLPPLQSSTIAPSTAEELAAAIADWAAHIYCFAGTELAKLPGDPAGDHLLDTLFMAIGDLDDIAKNTSGAMVREVLDQPRYES